MNQALIICTEIQGLISLPANSSKDVDTVVHLLYELDEVAGDMHAVMPIVNKARSWIHKHIRMLISEEFAIELEQIKPLLVPFWKIEEPDVWWDGNSSTPTVVYRATHIEDENNYMLFIYNNGNFYFATKYPQSEKDLLQLEPRRDLTTPIVQRMAELKTNEGQPIKLENPIEEYNSSYVHSFHHTQDDRKGLRVILSDVVQDPEDAKTMLDHVHTTLGLTDPYEPNMMYNRFYGDFKHDKPFTKTMLREKLNLV